MKIFHGISHYSTIDTPEAVFVIGGAEQNDNVAQFKEFQWHQLTNLRRGRENHGSIRIESHIMIIGGSLDEK